jgi:hypothetical protein
MKLLSKISLSAAIAVGLIGAPAAAGAPPETTITGGPAEGAMLTERAPAFTFEPGGPHGALARGDSGGAGAGGCAESEDRLRMRGDSASATGTNCTCGAEDEARLRMLGDGGGGSAAGCGTTGGRKHKRCVQAKEDRPQMRGSDEGAPPSSAPTSSTRSSSSMCPRMASTQTSSRSRSKRCAESPSASRKRPPSSLVAMASR